MFNKVETWVDLIQLEHTILQFWNKENAFEKLREKNAGNKHWSFQDGPITANNPMGVHHAWGRTLKDTYQRYHAMLGQELRYQNGFDCQGLWVEVEVEKELNFKNKRDIENFGIERFIELCKQRVLKFSKIQTDQSIRLGYWMDWNNSYYTMSDENNYMIWLFLKRCHERGFIYRGNDVMPWCPRCGTGISQHEMQEGYKEVHDNSVILRFPLIDDPTTALLVWTTTPWTLTSNVAAAVHPDLDYVKIRRNGITEILASARLEALFKSSEYEVLEHFPGKSLEGLRYKGPYDELPTQSVTRDRHIVIPWLEVSAADGTGIVHIAPGCGKEDYELGKGYNLENIAPIDEMGYFLPGFGWLTGLHAQEVSEKIMNDLTEKGILVLSERYLHSYPHCWRCKTALLFRLVSEWYISMDQLRHEIMDVVHHIQWIPDYGKELELDWLKNMRDWMISKKRYWGLALPIWVCEQCHSFDVIGGKEELQRRAVKGWDEFDGHTPHRPHIDKVMIRCEKCGGIAHRISEVGNPWLDAGIVPYSTMGYSSDRSYWEKWFPADLVLECFPGQFRNWFYSLLAMSTVMENRPPFRTLLGHANVRDEHGEEMHKSKGNAIWFNDGVEVMGADVMRWIFCGHDPLRNLNFGFGLGKEIRGKFFNKLWNVYAFFANYARIVGFEPNQQVIPLNERADLDRWIISNLHLMIDASRKAYETYDVKTVVRLAEEFVEDLSNWYVRLSRRRFWRGKDDVDSSMAYQTLYECLETFNRVIAPIIPFLTEEIYQNIVKGVVPESPLSVHHCEFPESRSECINAQLSEDMKTVMRITSLALAAREKANMRVRQPLQELIIKPQDDKERSAVIRFQQSFLTNVNVRKVTVMEVAESIPMEYSLQPEFKKLGPKFGARMKEVVALIGGLSAVDVKTLFDKGLAVTLTVDGKPYELTSNEITVLAREPKHLAIMAEGNTTVALTTTLDEELLLEGLMRDLLRNLQVLRRDVGLEIEDHIRLTYDTSSPKMQLLFEKWNDFMCSELLCEEIKQGTREEGWKTLNLQGEDITVYIERV